MSEGMNECQQLNNNANKERGFLGFVSWGHSSHAIFVSSNAYISFYYIFYFFLIKLMMVHKPCENSKVIH